MRVAVVGLGSIGRRHAANLRLLGVDDVAGMDPDADQRSRFTAETGASAFPDIESMLGAGVADLAMICSPNCFHLAQAMDFCRRGAHLFVEKPLATDRAGIDDLLAEIARRGLFAHYGSNWKFHPAFMTMKRLLDEGTIGKVTGAQVLAGQWLPDWHPWEDYRNGYSARSDLGGGVVFDSHELDYVTWLLGRAVSVRGFAVGSNALEIDTPDTVAACLKLASGAVVSLQLDYIQRAPRRRYHVTGTAGTIEWDLSQPRVSVYAAAQREWTHLPAGLDDINDMYLDQTRHLLDGVRGRAKPISPLADAAAVLDLQLTLMKTYREDQP